MVNKEYFEKLNKINDECIKKMINTYIVVNDYANRYAYIIGAEIVNNEYQIDYLLIDISGCIECKILRSDISKVMKFDNDETLKSIPDVVYTLKDAFYKEFKQGMEFVKSKSMYK